MSDETTIELQKPEESHVEVLRKEQLPVEIPEKLDKHLDRKFDRHIIPWLFGIWCVQPLAKTTQRPELTFLACG